MSLFGAIDISGSGIGVDRKWMDAVSDNLSNINDVAPTSGNAFQARYVVAQSVNYGSGQGGAQVAGIVYGNPAGRLVSDPGNPMADANGMVRVPDIDMGDQMGQLIMAQRGYEANLAVVGRAQAAYQAALQLGRKA